MLSAANMGLLLLAMQTGYESNASGFTALFLVMNQMSYKYPTMHGLWSTGPNRVSIPFRTSCGDLRTPLDAKNFMTAETELCSFLSTLSYNDLSPNVVERAKASIFSALACPLGGASASSAMKAQRACYPFVQLKP